MSDLRLTHAPAAQRPATLAVQVGPPYYCFTCGGIARGLTPWWPCGSELDAWAAHIAYLNLTCGCSERVARLGLAITPLRFFSDSDIADFHRRVDANREAVAAAVLGLAAQAPLEPGSSDPAERVVQEVLAGLIPPGAAIQRIRQWMSRQIE